MNAPQAAGGAPERLLVVGTGLIGTSVGQAASAAGYRVLLTDRDVHRLEVAQELGAGKAWNGVSPVDLAVVAVPPAVLAAEVATLVRAGIAPTITHVCSVQLRPQGEVEALIGRWPGFVGGHPIAGRERSGPHHAAGDLFLDRPWVICPTSASAPESVAAVERLARSCGAQSRLMTAGEHDALLARLSHAPQLLASALAGALVNLDRDQVSLAGSGLRDTSRLADSDPQLWAEIVSANPTAVAEALDAVLAPLVALRETLGTADSVDTSLIGSAVHELVRRGQEGRQRLAGKHGQAAVSWARVTVVVPDAPGALARLLADAAAGGVNVEDIHVDHSPGVALGLVDLDVAPGSADKLAAALTERDWRATAAEPRD
jgi:prephenate dehydrogenase